jgi:hypothetical protein
VDRRRRRHELVGRDELGQQLGAAERRQRHDSRREVPGPDRRATLAGTLKVNTGNGFVPGHGQSFSVLLYHTRSGMFGTLTGTPAYTVNYTATAANVVHP